MRLNYKLLIFLLFIIFFSFLPAKGEKENLLNEIPVDLVPKINYGLDLILERKYNEALKFFKEDLGPSYQYDARGPLGEIITYQVMMLEQDNFKFDKEYNESLKEAFKRLELEKKIENETAWYHFQKAAILGIDGLYQVRKENWFTALNRGLKAINSIETTLKINPKLYDALLGMGIYHYYRTIAKNKVKVLPIFGDYKAKGIEEIETSAKQGKVVNSFSKLALVYINMYEGKHEGALNIALEMENKYQNNILIKMLIGNLYRRMRDYEKSIDTFNKVLTIDKNYIRALYQIGLTFLYQKKELDKAEEYFNLFLKSNPDNEWKGYTYYRLGQISTKRKDYAQAIIYFEKSLKYKPGYKEAQHSLSKAKKELKKQKEKEK